MSKSSTTDLSSLLARNQAWSKELETARPGFFARTALGQSPQFLWIGCVDSRVCPERMLDLMPGELFVHRNIANLVTPADTSCHAVLQFAVEGLGVQHIIVCGHHGCGGVQAALEGGQQGAVHDWLEPARAVARHHHGRLERLPDLTTRVTRLCELNAIEQARNVCAAGVVQGAWRRGQQLTVHGWVYGLEDGLVRDTGFRAAEQAQVDPAYQQALAGLGH